MSHWAYYNENDPFAAVWLRNLIHAGEIADGIVDDRSIWDVRAEEIREFTQCHFFAGIGGWSHALRLAGWPDSRRVWTGSCPCQPFSAAGRQKGHSDERHLWPIWACLISECKPECIFGEQVAGAVGHGWLDAVSADLENEGYAFGAVVLGAHSVGAPHLRQRVWFVADAASDRTARHAREEAQTGKSCGAESGSRSLVGDPDDPRSQRRLVHAERPGKRALGPTSVAGGFWANADWLSCRDGKARPVEPGTFPLAHGVSGRVGRLRGYGNAIVPQVAAEVIRAYMEVAD